MDFVYWEKKLKQEQRSQRRKQILQAIIEHSPFGKKFKKEWILLIIINGILFFISAQLIISILLYIFK